MVGKRKYDDGCAVAHALDLVGERWSLLVVRDLLFGPKRFTELRSGLPGVSADVLTQRLRDLAEIGVVGRRRLTPPAASWVYELTPWGRQLEPIIAALAGWGSRSPGMRSDAPIGVDSFMLSLRVLFDAEAAAGLTASLAVHVGEDRFRVIIAGGQVDLTRGEPEQPDATLDTDLATLLALFRGDRPLREVLGDEARLEGDPSVVERVRRLFPLPPPASERDRSIPGGP